MTNISWYVQEQNNYIAAGGLVSVRSKRSDDLALAGLRAGSMSVAP